MTWLEMLCSGSDLQTDDNRLPASGSDDEDGSASTGSQPATDDLHADTQRATPKVEKAARRASPDIFAATRPLPRAIIASNTKSDATTSITSLRHLDLTMAKATSRSPRPRPLRCTTLHLPTTSTTAGSRCTVGVTVISPHSMTLRHLSHRTLLSLPRSFLRPICTTTATSTPSATPCP